MFKKMKLATKMGIGFGVLVVISGILGLVGWRGLTNVATNVELNRSGNECLQGLNQCASLRKDFALNGFEKAAKDDKNPAEKWHEAYTALGGQLQQLEDNKDLESDDKVIVTEAINKMAPYLTSFEHQKDARKTRDDAFQAWGKVGADVTREVATVISEVIEPARKAAAEAKNTDEMIKWTNIGSKLDELVFQEFLLLRVSAVYLLATNKEEQWANYQKQLSKAKGNVAAWADLVKGNDKIETVARNIAALLNNYEEAGQQYYAGMQAQSAADVEMAGAAKGIVDAIARLQTSLKGKVERITARTNTLMVTMATSGIVLGIVLAVLITLSIIKPIKRIIEA